MWWSRDNELLLAAFGRSAGCLVMGSGRLPAWCAWMRALRNHQQIMAISSSPCGEARSEPEKPLPLAVMIHKTESSTSPRTKRRAITSESLWVALATDATSDIQTQSRRWVGSATQAPTRVDAGLSWAWRGFSFSSSPRVTGERQSCICAWIRWALGRAERWMRLGEGWLTRPSETESVLVSALGCACATLQASLRSRVGGKGRTRI